MSSPTPGRRLGHLVAVACNVVILYLIHRSPGWAAVGFLTPRFEEALGLIDLSLATGMALNLVMVFWDPPRFKAICSVLTTGVGLAAMIRLWRVDPFDAGGWETVIHLLMVIAIVGSVIGLISQTFVLVRGGPRPKVPS